MIRRIEPGDPIIVVLHTPREKCWGILDEINPAGVFLRGLDLNSFDEWLRAVMRNEVFVGLNDMFLPVWRVERIIRDEGSNEIPALFEQAERHTKQRLVELFGRVAAVDNDLAS